MMTKTTMIRRHLLVSACFPIALHSGAMAQQTVTVDTPTTAVAVTTSINTAIATPSRDLTLAVTAPGVITNGNVSLFPPAAGRGDGAIVVSNLGSFGTVDAAGVPTNTAGISFLGNTLLADNSFVGTNAGLITGGVQANNFGGAASLSNSGTIYGGVGLSARGDVTMTTAGSGRVASGNVGANSQDAVVTVVSGPVSTTTRTSGNASVSVGNVGTTVTRGDVTAFSRGNTSVAASGIARQLSATSSGTSVNTSQAAPPVAGSTVVTSSTTNSVSGGNASVTTAGGSDVLGVSVAGVGTGTATIGGGVVNNVFVSSGGANTTNRSTETRNANNNTTETVFESTSTRERGRGTVTVAATGSVGSTVSVSGDVGASATIAGGVVGGVSANSTGTSSTSRSAFTNSFDANNLPTGSGSAFRSTQAAAGGAAEVIIASGGTIGSATAFASATASGDLSASVTNNGTVSGNVSATSARSVTLLNESSSSSLTTTTATTQTNVVQSSNSFDQRQVGGTASVTNSATGLIGTPAGGVTATGIGDVTVVNAGSVRGTTNATSQGSNFTSGNTSNSTAVLTFAVPPALATTTRRDLITERSATTIVGGNVTGTYSGENGTLNFTPAASGSITQTANGTSTATVSGAVFGTVTSQAGQSSSTTRTFESTSVDVRDSSGTGTGTFTSTETNTSSRGANSASRIIVSGTVGFGNAGGAGQVTSIGGGESSVAINSGNVVGATATATGVQATTSTNSATFARNFTANTPTTTALTEAFTSSTTTTSGTASANLTGTGLITNSLSVTGLAGATATMSTDTRVNGQVNVGIGGTNDLRSTINRSYTRDATSGLVASVDAGESVSAPSAGNGNASATIAGTVGSTVNVTARSGNATTTITGSIGGTAGANTGASTTTTTNRTTFEGVLPASQSTTFGGLNIPVAGGTIPSGGRLVVASNSNTVSAGGTAAVVIDTSAALQARGIAGAFNASASGFGGATVDINAGSRITGSATASSAFTNSVTESTATYLPTSQTRTIRTVQTAVGGPVAVTNRGDVAGSLVVNSIGGATVTNNFRAGGIAASAIATNTTTTTVSNNFLNPAIATETVTQVSQAVGGVASITNAARAVVNGSVTLGAARTGTFTNNGFVQGVVNLGAAVAEQGTLTIARTDGSSVSTFTPAAARFAQAYTVEQNSIIRGINVAGATVLRNNVTTGVPETVRTSDIAATINLNNGSVTLGNIIGQTDPLTRERLTDTVVNLRGSGWLGVDAIAATPPARDMLTPSLRLSEEAIAVYGANPISSVRVEGVRLLQKQDAGTFVIYGTALQTSTVPGVLPVNTLDVGQFAINAGEVQLGVAPQIGAPVGTVAAATPVFGIRGDVVNNATLVLGRRVPSNAAAFGASIVGAAPERIAGITVRQTGNFTQSATGSLVVGFTPGLVRAGTLAVTGVGNANELLGPVAGGVAVPFFTTPANAGVAVTTSRVDVTGNLNLAGTVRLNVTRDGLYRNGDGYTMFTYTGTGAVAATVAPSLTSSFVGFDLVNDTAARTVRLSARRSSFASAATNSNAAAAAVALDGALDSIATRITADASGGAAFASVTELDNAQDVANIISALDWRLTGAQASQVFDELSSAEIYGSLAAIDQNVVFGQTAQQLTNAVSLKQPLKSRIWLNPVGDFARYSGDTATGAAQIRSDAYGLAFGGDLAFSADGAVGFGGSYAEHTVTSDPGTESAGVRTWTIGAYAAQGFGDAYVSGQLAYGFSSFDVTRNPSLLARQLNSSFRGSQFDASIEGGYNFAIGDGIVATPFAALALRSWSMNETSEAGAGGGGVAVAVDKASKSIFNPVIGGRIAARFETSNTVALMPYAKASYTFQGDIGSDRTVRMVGAGNSFVVNGVNPGGFGTVEIGMDTVVNNRINLFLGGAYAFAGGNNLANVRGGISFAF